ncbi:LuxR family transcriptional regulator [Roseobacter sp. HKCCD9010]|uniref:helix-turn-helix transcriptional regulator n=1 Tax=unclassified Roseobacter TaxID=196798 RepID=UPI00149309EA|nr:MULTISPECIES: LuxR family transcriptional regulator [unclassified Roseobacter]MBF9051233.1 LuxR family transcriptional regulator [Rhodobacterales bacterium HKCCD4356]NNV13280.1 LuxR family transcriptional regulator [Roseobacter sp. HKCCD7357]NNV17531.1 LuxR family transcriptional regulator [Roseobacter sp. HKCCD8768]NNV27137.1 LuxR family transcriptional regulator [Roseobacter sp. HKCCD8192]NNV31257.1 LuxR family transcriptional regulator [Roseobacter sp. HKCCD9061]
MSRNTVLWGLFALQAICCAYFLLDITLDFISPGMGLLLVESDLAEAVVTIALFVSLAFTASELRQMMSQQRRLSDQLKVASGAFTDLLETRFAEWSLTAAEREVAILALKGFAIADMAELRATKLGTVKAQCAAVYRKAKVSGRLELLSLFLDDLLADELVPISPAPGQ